MPRRKGVPAYRLHKPSGQARVISDGRHVYLGPYGSEESKAEYERLIRKLLPSLDTRSSSNDDRFVVAASAGPRGNNRSTSKPKGSR